MKKIYTILALLASLPNLASAETSVQAQCYATLVQNMTETSLLQNEVDYLKNISYQDLEPQFSQKYKTLSSLGVGIGIDEPRFATRLFSFGEPTGYIHPPQTFMPDSVKSEVWSASTNQYMVAEEYVVDDSGVEHFLGCFFIGMTAPDLLAVTAGSYAGDAPGISLNKTAADGSYKAWFAQVPSFNPEGKPLVTWTKVFVYPKAASNPYFSKYVVADAYPANRVESFAVLNFLAQPHLKVEDFDEVTGAVVTKYLDLDSGAELATPPELSPFLPTGINQTHPLASYYQAIKAAFPEFSVLLAVRGTLKFSTFIELVTNPNSNPELDKFLDSFSQTRQLNEYYQLKQNPDTAESVNSPEFDRLIALLQHGEWVMTRLKDGESFSTLIYTEDEVEIVSTPVEPVKEDSRVILYLLSAVVALLVLGIIYKQIHKTTSYEKE